MKRIIAAVLFVVCAAPVWAQVVTCNGLECTTEEGGKIRKMTKEESLSHLRSNALGQINGQIRCELATDQAQCKTLKSQILKLFIE